MLSQQATMFRTGITYAFVRSRSPRPPLLLVFNQIPEPYALLALIYKDGGKLDAALQFYKLACSRDTRNWGNHQEAARIAGQLGDHTSRLEALRVLARLKPDNLEVAIDRARCLVELQKPRQVGSGVEWLPWHWRRMRAVRSIRVCVFCCCYWFSYFGA